MLHSRPDSARRALTRALVLAALAVVAGPREARANPLDTYGYTSRAIGMGGGFTAAASGHEAAYYNLAGQQPEDVEPGRSDGLPRAAPVSPAQVEPGRPDHERPGHHRVARRDPARAPGVADGEGEDHGGPAGIALGEHAAEQTDPSGSDRNK